MMGAFDYLILPTPRSPEYFPCKDEHPWVAMKGQENLTGNNLGTWLQTLLYLPVGHKVKGTARNLHSSLKFMPDQANKEVAAVLQCWYNTSTAHENVPGNVPLNSTSQSSQKIVHRNIRIFHFTYLPLHKDRGSCMGSY